VQLLSAPTAVTWTSTALTNFFNRSGGQGLAFLLFNRRTQQFSTAHQRRNTTMVMWRFSGNVSSAASVIPAVCSECRISGVRLSGCSGFGIYLGPTHSTVVESCHRADHRHSGITANDVFHSPLHLWNDGSMPTTLLPIATATVSAWRWCLCAHREQLLGCCQYWDGSHQRLCREQWFGTNSKHR